MADVTPPKIEFPCAYPLKIIGHAADDFREFVITVLERHTDRIDEETIDIRASSGGKFVSVRVTITATGEEQLKNIFTEFKASGRVQAVI
jgi:putative lipoic acid-binding regulatory protein